MLVLGRILESGHKGRRWPAQLICAGKSLNAKTYEPACIRESAPLFEGAPANAFPLIDAEGNIAFDHVGPDNLVGMSILNQVGSYEHVRFDESAGALVGDLVLIEGDEWADKVQRHLEALEAAGKLDSIGLSIDAQGPISSSGVVSRFDHVVSVDIVTHPAAGGRIGHRIAASRRPTPKPPARGHGGSKPMTLIERLRARWPRMTEGLSHLDKKPTIVASMAKRLTEMLGLEDPVVEEEQEVASLAGFLGQDIEQLKKVGPEKVKDHLEGALAAVEALEKAPDPEEGGGDDPDDEGKPKQIKESVPVTTPSTNRIEAAEKEAAAILKRAQLRESRTLLEDACRKRKLPAKATARLIESHKDSVLTEAQADTIAKAENEYLGEFISENTPGRTVSLRESGDKARDVLAAMLSPRFRESERGKKARAEMQDVGGSLHRYMEAFTGIDVRDWSRGQAARLRMRESVDTTNFDQAFADALGIALLAEYQGLDRYRVYEKIVKFRDLQDFRSYKTVNLGYYGNLPDVAKGTSYNALTTPTDRQETIALAKKGGTESILMEDMLDDNIGVWEAMISRIGRAAIETAFDTVFALIRKATQPTLSDAKKLSDQTRSPANEGTAALTADATGKTNFITAVTNMMKGTGGSGEKKGATPRYAILPLEKVEAFTYVVQQILGGNTGTQAEEVLKNLRAVVPEPIIDLGTSNATDWGLLADPMEFPVIEFATLGGRRDPEIFIADDDRFGNLFLKDQIDLKVRFIYAAAAVDYLGFYFNDAAS